MSPDFSSRKRQFPLIPEPYGPVVLQNNLRGKIRDWDVFVPDLDADRHCSTMSEAAKKDFELRAANLKWLADKNEDIRASEYTWEADIRSIVFGKIIEDERLVMYVLAQSVLSRS
jgi:hypothetical protein